MPWGSTHSMRSALFSAWAGVSPKRFLGLLTVEHAKSLLRADESVLGAAYEVGLSGGSRLHDLFVTLRGDHAGRVQGLGADLVLRWGVHETPFGAALFVASERGLDPPGLSRRRAVSTRRWRRPWPTGR